MNILGLIPARGGSKGIPHKNLAMLGGRPLLAYTCEAAKNSTRLSRCILSTDDRDIADAGHELGVEVPFLRPLELAGDDTPMMAVMRHAVAWLQEHERYPVDLIVLLQPTSPFRRSEHIDAAVQLLEDTSADTVVSVVPVPHQFAPESVMSLDGPWLRPLVTGGALQRQRKAHLYARNGPAVLVVRPAVLAGDSPYCGKVAAYLMSALDSIDIDSSEDLALAERLFRGTTSQSF